MLSESRAEGDGFIKIEGVALTSTSPSVASILRYKHKRIDGQEGDGGWGSARYEQAVVFILRHSVSLGAAGTFSNIYAEQHS